MTRVKICGITREEDAVTAAALGADAVGLVFARSPRRVTVEQARRIVSALPPFVEPVGVFAGAGAAVILRTAAEAGLAAVQLHGDEPPALVERLGGLRVIKAIRVRSASFADEARRFADAGVCGILLDSFSRTARGGTGALIDVAAVAAAQRKGALRNLPPLIVAGGLTPARVAGVIRRIRPWGVDVSSGVEVSPGVKSARKIAAFIKAARGTGAAG